MKTSCVLSGDTLHNAYLQRVANSHTTYAARSTAPFTTSICNIQLSWVVCQFITYPSTSTFAGIVVE